MQWIAPILCLTVLWACETVWARRNSNRSRSLAGLTSELEEQALGPPFIGTQTLSDNVQYYYGLARTHSDYIVGSGDFCFATCLPTWIKTLYNAAVAYTNIGLLEFQLGVRGKSDNERYRAIQKHDPDMSRKGWEHVAVLLKNFVKTIDRNENLQTLMGVVFGVSTAMDSVGNSVRQILMQQNSTSTSSVACFLRLCLDEAESMDNFKVKSRIWWDSNTPPSGCTSTQGEKEHSDSELSIGQWLLPEAVSLARDNGLKDIVQPDVVEDFISLDTAPADVDACVTFVRPNAYKKWMKKRRAEKVRLSLGRGELLYELLGLNCQGEPFAEEPSAEPSKTNKIETVSLLLVNNVTRTDFDRCITVTAEFFPTRSFCFFGTNRMGLSLQWQEALSGQMEKLREHQHQPVSLLMRHAAVLSSRHSSQLKSERDEECAIPATDPTIGTSLLEDGDALFTLDLQHSNLSQHQVEANRLWIYGASLKQNAKDRASMKRAQEVLARATKHLMAATGGVEPHTTAAAATTAGSSGPLTGILTVYSIWIFIKFLFGSLKDLLCAVAAYKAFIR
eukprot:TRINITY_DN10084_c1_g1_i1.p1 TRINITY_DN10084_c1_g1~~TRINITY_DN10084_c1_g1_i1.p1  ORF type:complete len:562 (-),score=35.38 TRINITY_DN10084_c1_g1_i1:159-1844(-)